MKETQHDSTHLSRRGILAATAGIAVGAGVSAVPGAPAAGSPASTDGATIQAGVNFGEWGTIFLAPGQAQNWWFTWIFDGHRWSRMSALPLAESPAGSSIQIVAEWANIGQLWVRFQNNSAVGVIFRPTVIVAPF